MYRTKNEAEQKKYKCRKEENDTQQLSGRRFAF